MPFFNEKRKNFCKAKRRKEFEISRDYHPILKGNHLYEGDLLNKTIKHGFGLSSIRKENVFVTRYKGNYNHDEKDGIGHGYFKDGSYYFGEWKQNLQCGFGKMWFTDGSFYGGYWKCGKFHGEGLFVDVDGNRFEGNWQDGVKHGFGRLFHLLTGQMQEGAWFNDAAISTTIEDLPLRSIVISPTKYMIPENDLERPGRIIIDTFLTLFAKNQVSQLELMSNMSITNISDKSLESKDETHVSFIF